VFISLQEVFGGNAASDEYHIARHVANLFVVQTYEGQSDIHGKFIVPNGVGPRLILFNSIDSGPCHHGRAGLCLKKG
jgi:glutaryl-CoA dehydrogenase